MSTRSLPIGWGQRGNASDPNVKGERPGDWREMDLASKYKRDGMEDKEARGSKVPLGFGSRSNMKTLEELSLSGSASEVAVAEVNLKNMPRSGLTSGDLGTSSLILLYTSSETSRRAPAAVPAPGSPSTSTDTNAGGRFIQSAHQLFSKWTAG